MSVIIINPNSTVSMTEAMLAQARRAAPSQSFEGWTSHNGPPAIQGEKDGETATEPLLKLVEKASKSGANGIIIGCFDDTALDEAAAISDPIERADMLDGLGLVEGALFRMVRSAYHLLGLRTFFTTGDKESRAWTFREGSTAPVCAGRIHTDFQRGFIRAEVIEWEQLLELGSWNASRDVGKLRLEGKDYIASDGDVMEFRFNV